PDVGTDGPGEGTGQHDGGRSAKLARKPRRPAGSRRGRRRRAGGANLTVTKGGIAGSMPDGMGPFFLTAAARGEAGKPGSAPAVVSPPQTCHEVFFPP